MAHRNTFAKINLNFLQYNLDKIFSESNKGLFCVVKANAYGHGITQISKHLIRDPHVKYLCVSSIDEALYLRKSLEFPILNMGYTDIEDLKFCIDNNITVALPSLKWFESAVNAYNDLSQLKMHVKLDTGMNRLGIKEINEYKTLIHLAKKIGVTFEGIFSHYHSSGALDHSSSLKQLDLFKTFLNCEQYEYKWIHIANSDAVNDIKDNVTNAVRCGLSMYGYSSKKDMYKPVLSLFTTVTQIKNVRSNETVGYSATHVITDEERIAILPIGYADGLNRKLCESHLFINNTPVKILGNICMDQTIIEYPQNLEEKTVEIIGKNQSALDIAEVLETIPYEVLTGLSHRITRLYYLDGLLLFEENFIKDN